MKYFGPNIFSENNGEFDLNTEHEILNYSDVSNQKNYFKY